MTPRVGTVALLAVCASPMWGYSSTVDHGVEATGQGAPTVSRIVALPSSDRTSLMIELTSPLPSVTSTMGSGGTSVTIEAGPIGEVAQRELVPTENSSLIASVSIRMYRRAPDAFVRVLV